MRTIAGALMILLVATISITLAGCGNFKYDDTRVDVEAQVLSVNKSILRGEMIGDFLSSANGTIADDVNIVGVSFLLGGSLFLEDIEMSHSMLAYYNGKNVLPIEIEFEAWRTGSYRAQLRIDGYRVKHNFFSREGINRILDRELEVQDVNYDN